MTDSKNIKTFDELLEIKYGKIGSRKRDQFHEDAKKFIVDEMIDKLESLLRRVVREELERVIEEKGNIFHLEPEIPLYQDMQEILQRKKEGKIELYSEEEVCNG